ncbi:SHOCT domain-containing protein [Mitsuaria sp. CC2]
MSELQGLANLRDKGILTEDELAQQKAKLLAN